MTKTLGIIPGTTICGLSDGAAWPVKNAINKNRSDFEEWINSGRKSTLVSLKMGGGHGTATSVSNPS